MDGKGENKIKLIKGHVDDEQLWKLKKCQVRETTTFCGLIKRIVRSGLGEIIIRRICGRHFLIEIPYDDLLSILKQNDWSYLKEFFIKIEPWS